MLEDYIGLVLGERYEIQAPLGSGGMALVFRAHDRALDRQVAIKIVKPGLFPSAEIPEAADRFIREARIIANLEHAHILKVYDQGKQLIEGQTLVYLVMQLASGGTLAKRIERQGPLTPYEAQRILKQVCSALDHAHSHRVIHLDLTPANILFDEQGNALVADFGLARLFHTTSHVTTQTIAGTLPYMPYEQWLGKHAGRLSDVYALGITLYQALTGELPERVFAQEGIRVHLTHPLPPGIGAVIERATQSDPGARYHTAGELAQAFTAAVAPPPPEWGTEVEEGEAALLHWEEPEEVPTPSERPPPKRSWIPYVAIGLAALAVVASLVVLGAVQRRWERRAEATLAAISLALTASPTGTATPTVALSLSPMPTPSSNATLTPIPSPTPYLVVPVEQLLIHAGPGENYDAWGEIRRGDRLPLCGRSADGVWWQVDYLGRKGWIRAQAVGANVEPTILPPVEPPPTPRRTATPTREPTPTPLGPNTVLRLQNPGFDGILQENAIPGWQWWAEDNYGAGEEYDPGTSFDTPVFTQAEDPARMINGPTLQIEATAFVNLRVHVFQTVSAPPSATVRFQVSAKAFSNAGGIRLAAGIDPDGGPDCSQARWGDELTIDQSWGAVQLFAPDMAVGPTGRATVCLRAENVNPGRSNAAYFDNAALIANPE
jgi:serine/threonine protein kinase